MPLPPTSNMSLVLPVISGDPNVWGQLLNDAMELRLDVHNHAPGNGVRVPTAGMHFDANLNLNDAGTTRGLLDCRAVGMASITPAQAATFGACVFRNSSDADNFYIRTAAGQLVRINNGAALDVSGAGGFLGDYAAVGADARYDDGTDAYWFRQQQGAGVNQYARIRSADVDLYEYKAHPAAAPPTNRVRIASPAALAASYTLTLPPAVPASNGLFLQVSTAGVMTFGNTGIQAITMAASQNITLSGTGEVKHGTRTIKIPALAGVMEGAIGAVSGIQVIGDKAIANTGGALWYIPIPHLMVGDRIVNIRWWYLRVGGTLNFRLRKKTTSTGVASNQATTSSASGTTYTSIAQNAVNYTLVSTEVPYLQWQCGASGDELHEVEIDWDHP